MRFTGESETKNVTLETYEWDSVWFEKTEKKDAKRILYIGDSISCGTRHLITTKSKNTVLTDGFGTSKALDNPYFIPALEVCIKQETQLDAVLFNNGHHGFHLGIEEYEACYRRMLDYLAELGVPVYVLLSTGSIEGPEKRAVIEGRNAVASKLAAEYGFPVIDIYAVTVDRPDIQAPDNIHFTEEGYGVIAKTILESLRF